MKRTNVSEIIRERQSAPAGNYASGVGPRRWLSLSALCEPPRFVLLTRCSSFQSRSLTRGEKTSSQHSSSALSNKSRVSSEQVERERRGATEAL